MVSVDAHAVEIDGITLVTGLLRGGAVPARVTVRNRLDGPAWPPRRMGRPEAGWDDRGYQGVVQADGVLAIGYACPAPAADPPLEVVDTERAEDCEEDFDSATAVLRGLGSPAPPRAALALPAGDASGRSDDDGSLTSSVATEVGDRLEDDRSSDGGSAAAASPTPSDDAVGNQAQAADTSVPAPVATWLDDVETRLERAERLADATDVPAATEALRTIGSLAAANGLEARRQADTERLRTVARRANALAYRAERAAIPVDAFDRLA